MVDGFMLAAVWGTPDRILLEFEKRRDVVGEFELATSFRFGGIPRELAEQSIDLFAKEVLPVLKSWKVPLGSRRNDVNTLTLNRVLTGDFQWLT